MARKRQTSIPDPEESYKDMEFPLAGLDQSMPFSQQRPKQMQDGQWARTCRDAQNVRAYEQGTDRARGGSRPGIMVYIPATPIPGWVLQELAVLVGIGYPAPSTSPPIPPGPVIVGGSSILTDHAGNSLSGSGGALTT